MLGCLTLERGFGRVADAVPSRVRRLPLRITFLPDGRRDDEEGKLVERNVPSLPANEEKGEEKDEERWKRMKTATRAVRLGVADRSEALKYKA